MVLEICPSADVHLGMIAPFNAVTLKAVLHDETGSRDILAPDLGFELEGKAPAGGFLDNGEIRVELATGRLTALHAGDITFLRAVCDQTVSGVPGPFRVSIRIVVHEDFGSFWIGDSAGRLMAGTDSFVPTILAENSDGQVVDITGHGFVQFSLDRPVDGCAVDAESGRVTAGLGAAGNTLLVNVDRGGGRLDQLPVYVTPAVDEQDGEPSHVTDSRQILEELPFEPSGVIPRRNILLVAEGFARRDEHEFRSFALKLNRRLRKRRVHEPFKMLRDDYRIWTAFAESPASGVTITTRIDRNTGELVQVSELEASRRLLQGHDTPFGLSYGRRAGEVSFAAVPPPAPQGDGQPQVVVTAEEEWSDAPREPRQMVKDWRRLGRNRSRWNASSIEWFASLRKKGATPLDPQYEIGRNWAAGGADQGLVLVIGNAEVNAGRYEPGDPDHGRGYLFGTVSLGQEEKTVTLTSDGPRCENLKSTRFGSGGYNAKMARALVAIHELAHGIFLGDEYDDVHQLRETDQKSVFHYDNVDSSDWIDIASHTKWSLVPRVIRSGTLAEPATASSGSIDVVLRSGEGSLWAVAPGEPVAALQTRNINGSSVHMQLYERYPAFRAHAPIQVPRLLGPAADPPDALLRVAAISGNRITLTGSALTAGMVFPAGSMLFAPMPGPDGPLSLVLPGVLAHMRGYAQPLSGKGGLCTAPVRDRITRPSVAAATLGIDPPPKYHQVVGLHEGGGGFNCGVYRPTGECMMRTQFELVRLESTDKYVDVAKIPFCHVCRYTIVQEFNPSRHAELDLLYPGSPLP